MPAKDIISKEKQIYKTTLIGSFVNLVLMIIKFLAGIFGNSSALVADAAHSMSDFLTDVVVIVFVKISNTPSDENHKYGHGKFETLATLLISLVLLGIASAFFISSAKLIWEVLFYEKILTSPSSWAFIVALLSILFKEMVYQYTAYVSKKINSQILLANAWHHRSDSLSSIAVALGIGASIFFGHKWAILEPVSALIVSLFIAKVAIVLGYPSIEEMLEKALPKDVENEILDVIMAVDGVRATQNLKTRKIGENVCIDVDIAMDSNISLKQANAISENVELKLRENFGKNAHIGIHIKPM